MPLDLLTGDDDFLNQTVSPKLICYTRDDIIKLGQKDFILNGSKKTLDLLTGDDSIFIKEEEKSDSGKSNRSRKNGHEPLDLLTGDEDIFQKKAEISSANSRPSSPISSCGTLPKEFTDNELGFERASIITVHIVLARAAKVLTLMELYEEIQDWYGIMAKIMPFPYVMDLEEWIIPRSHIFRYSKADYTVINTGFGYRLGIMQLVQFIHEVEKTKKHCTMEDLYRKYSELPKYTWLKPGQREKQMWDDSWFLEYPLTKQELKQHLMANQFELFKFEGEIVGLRSTSYRIPSVWKQFCLPQPPTKSAELIPHKRNGKEFEEYFDASRVSVFVVKIVAVLPLYVKADIRYGPFVGRRIIIYGKRFGCEVGKMWKLFKKFIPMAVQACPAFTTAGDFIAVHAEPIPPPHEMEATKSLLRSTVEEDTRATYCRPEDLEDHPEKKDLYDRIEQIMRDNDVKESVLIPDDLCEEIVQIIEAEHQRLMYLKFCMGDATITEVQMFLKFEATRDNSPFDEFKDLCQFIFARPYLYTVSQKEMSFDIIYELKSRDEKEIFRQIFEYLDSHIVRSITDIQQKLISGDGGELLQDIAEQNRLQDYIEQLFPNVRLLFVSEEKGHTVRLQGTYFEALKVFVPFISYYSVEE